MFIKSILFLNGIVSISDIIARKRVYNEALGYSRMVNKPLVVVGGPLGGMTIFEIFDVPIHGFGDICIDIDEKACRNENFLKASITKIPLPDKFAGAVYCAHVLEHLPDVDSAIQGINELYRISDKAFILTPSKLALSAWLHPDHKLWIYNKDGKIIIEQR